MIMKIAFVPMDEKQFGVRFPYDLDLARAMRSIPGAYWSRDQLAWLVPQRETTILSLLDAIQGCTVQIAPALRSTWTHRRDEFPNVLYRLTTATSVPDWDAAARGELRQRLKARGYRDRTLKAYAGHVQRFIQFVRERDMPWDEQLLMRYHLELQGLSFSHSYINQAISAVSFYLRMYARRRRFPWTMLDRSGSRSCRMSCLCVRYYNCWGL
jgi:hypothetical protein